MHPGPIRTWRPPHITQHEHVAVNSCALAKLVHRGVVGTLRGDHRLSRMDPGKKQSLEVDHSEVLELDVKTLGKSDCIENGSADDIGSSTELADGESTSTRFPKRWYGSERRKGHGHLSLGWEADRLSIPPRGPLPLQFLKSVPSLGYTSHPPRYPDLSSETYKGQPSTIQPPAKTAVDKKGPQHQVDNLISRITAPGPF